MTARRFKCPVCGREYELKKYFDKQGKDKGYEKPRKTCSRACGGILRRSKLPESFWAKVDCSGGADACWKWTGSRNWQGYGRVRYEHKTRNAHRVSWAIANGREPEGDVRHTCDNPPCVNPAHLVDGTTRDNILDMERKGRAVHYRGSENGRAKLSDDDVRAIRKDTRSQTVIAQVYGIHQTQVSRIKLRKQWAHVPS